MWTVEQRQAHARAGLRYPSDLTDAEWSLVEPFIPPAKRGGRKRTVDVREVLDGLLYVLATGCQWRALPQDLPPKSTVHGYLTLWAWDGTIRRLHHALFVQVREQAGKEASPTAAIIDSQSVKGAKKGGAHRSVGPRRGQEGQGQEAAHPGRHARPAAERRDPSRRRPGPGRGHPAAARRTPAVPVRRGDLRRRRLPGRGDRGGGGRDRPLEIVSRGGAAGVVPLAKRWIVERTFAWLGRCRRLAKDFENLAVNALAFLCLGMIRLMVRRLARPSAV